MHSIDIAPSPKATAAALARLCVSALAALAVATAAPAPARAQSVPVIRDAEIEALLTDYAGPILRAAGLIGKGIDVIIVNDQRFNAFVDGRRIFVNTGALTQARTPNEIIGVIAHEAGHLAGGHQQRLREQMARARTLAVVGTLLGVGAAAAGGASGARGAAGAGAGLASSSGTMASRFLLSYRRSEEVNADQAAVRYLNATGQSAAGMLATFERFSQGLALAGVQVNPYEQSHPMPRERIALLEELARQSPHFASQDPPSLRLRHDLVRAKIAAHTGGQGAVQQLFRDDPRGLAARYGDAIATHLGGNTRAALAKIDGLIGEQPNNPYMHEMRGEMLIAAGQAPAAVEALERAVRLDGGDSALIRGRLGFALLQTGNRQRLDEAIQALRASLSADPDNFSAYRQLSQAYGQAGDLANAELIMAEGYFRIGNRREALSFAARARQKFQPGTPGWTRANDILTVAR